MSGERQIISIDDLSEGDISRLFLAARKIESCKWDVAQELSQRQIILAFFEPSTRTKLSFAMATNKLGASALTFDPATSSQLKGESSLDSIKTLAAMGPDLLVIRQREPMDAADLSELKINIINAGDGEHEHPTQSLLDCFALMQRLGCDDLSGRKVLICGDVARSRVYHSNFKLMKRLGARVMVMAPKILADDSHSSHPIHFANFEDIKEKFDAVMILRVQEERMGKKVIDRQEYFASYGLNYERFQKLGPDCLLLHPGPLINGVEIDGSLATHERSLVLNQVRAGVIVRAAALSTLFSFGERYA